MNSNLFYTQNFYTLKRNKEINDFITFLNLDERLQSLISDPLEDLVNIIYSTLLNKELGLDLFIKNGEEINEIILQALKDNSPYKKSNASQYEIDIFSNAYKKLTYNFIGKEYSHEQVQFSESLITNWLEDNLAKTIAKDNRFKDYELLLKLIDEAEIYHIFFDSLCKSIPLEWINDDWENWTKSSTDFNVVLHSLRSYEEYFKTYPERIKNFNDFSTWKYVITATEGSDYALFNHEYSIKNIFLFENDIKLWLIFWDNLTWPLLQDVPFTYFQNPESILKISTELTKQVKFLKSNPKLLANLLLKNLFDNSLKTQDNLSFYVDQNKLASLSASPNNEEFVNEGREMYSSWQLKKRDNYKNVIKHLLTILTIEEIGEWVFSYNKINNGSQDYIDRYNLELDLLTSVYDDFIKSTIDLSVENISKNPSLTKFTFFISKLTKENTTAHQAEYILDQLINFVLKSDFYWDGRFSPTYWPVLKGIGQLLSMIDTPINNAIELIKSLKINYEGWNISENSIRQIGSETFVYCGIILLLEHEDSFKDEEEINHFFSLILDLCISQTRFSTFDVDKNYKPAFSLLNLVVNQIRLNLKKDFETKIINEIDNIITVVEILSTKEYILSKEAKPLIKKRIEHEFNYERRKMMQRGQNHELEQLEKAILLFQLDA
jgi:hypothetical protein